MSAAGLDADALSEDGPSIGVLVCSYRRPDDLLRCLASLTRQRRTPDDIIVVIRSEDVRTANALTGMVDRPATLRILIVDIPGLVHARNVGLDACRTDILAMIDDDAVPYEDWLSRIVDHFVQNPDTGGLGGRDRCHDGERFDDRSAEVVGRLQWFGRTIGNHHLGAGRARPVDFLKGANMTYRRAAFTGLRFDNRLLGQGAQPFEDIAFSMGIRKAGWKLVYDPTVAVDHFVGDRDESRLYVGIFGKGDMRGLYELAFNEVIALTQGLSVLRKLVYALWSFGLGTGVSPGLIQVVRYLPRLGSNSWRRFRTVQRGKLAACAALLFPVSTGTRKT